MHEQVNYQRNKRRGYSNKTGTTHTPQTSTAYGKGTGKPTKEHVSTYLGKGTGTLYAGHHISKRKPTKFQDFSSFNGAPNDNDLIGAGRGSKSQVVPGARKPQWPGLNKGKPAPGGPVGFTRLGGKKKMPGQRKQTGTINGSSNT